jgi:hypothetical protein
MVLGLLLGAPDAPAQTPSLPKAVDAAAFPAASNTLPATIDAHYVQTLSTLRELADT